MRKLGYFVACILLSVILSRHAYTREFTPIDTCSETMMTAQHDALEQEGGHAEIKSTNYWLLGGVALAVAGVKWLINRWRNKKEEAAFIRNHEHWSKDDFYQEALQQSCSLQLMNSEQSLNYSYWHALQALYLKFSYYQFVGFQELLISLPGFHDFVHKLKEQLLTDRNLQQKVTALPGFNTRSFTNVIDELCIKSCCYNVCATNRVREQYLAQHMRMQEKELMIVLQQLANVDNSVATQERLAKRARALDAYNEHVYYEHKDYEIPTDSKEFLYTHKQDATRYAACFGNQVQHVIHDECVRLTNIFTSLWRKHHDEISVFALNILSTVVDVGAICNHAGYVVKACIALDACWMMVQKAETMTHHMRVLYDALMSERSWQGLQQCIVDYVHLDHEDSILNCGTKKIEAFCKHLKQKLSRYSTQELTDFLSTSSSECIYF